MSAANIEKVVEVLGAMRNSGIIRKKLEDILERHDLVVKWKKEKWRFIDEDET